MKTRPEWFLTEDKIDHNSEIFDYIQELHQYLWCFVRVAIPSASGDLRKYLDIALDEATRKLKERQ